MTDMIFSATERDGYEAPDPDKRIVQYLIDPDSTPLRNLISGLTTLEPGQRTGLAQHDAEEMYFILEGHVRVRLGDTDTEKLGGPLTVVAIAPNVPHQIFAEEERVRFLWVSSPAPEEVDSKRTWRHIPAADLR